MDRMENSNNILQEIQEISPLIAAIEKRNVFTVPDGYFDWVSENVFSAIKYDDAVVFNNQSGHIPQGYFDGLAESIMTRIKTVGNESAGDELRILSPMLYSVQNENVFTVPDGYFDTFHDVILDKVKPRPAKLVSFKRKTSVVIKYSVAAAFTGVMALGVFRFTETRGKTNQLPDYVIDGLKIKDVDQELSKLSDDAIIQYLEASGSDVKTALVVNSVDENNLPSEEDYLFDEQALDKYLNSINISETKN
ncbi:MAG: hypothetical protein J0L54_07060 [Chitinophagales bacterium]|nr:hypothetical protein [Chitinophagales bacterium]